MNSRGRAALQFGVFTTVFFAAWTLRATTLYGIDETIQSPAWRAAYSNLVKLLLWVLPAAGFVRWIRKSVPLEYLGLSGFPNRHQWQRCLIMTAAFLLVVSAFALSLGSKSFSIARVTSLPLAVGLLSFVLSPFLEEILFRGFMLREFLSFWPLAIANTFTSLLFVAVHVPFWLAHGGLTAAVWANLGGVFLFSLLAGWLSATSRSVYPATLAHIGNNLLAALLVTRGA